MYVKDNEIITEAHDYMTVWEGGYKQRKLTPTALAHHIRLRKELQTRRDEQHKIDLAEVARKIKAERAEKARIEKEARQKALDEQNAARRAKVEDSIRERVNSANPGIKPEELNRVVARMLEDHFVEQTTRSEEQVRRHHLAGWNEASGGGGGEKKEEVEGEHAI